ncbi:hypothetical protein MUGA111182_19785 [Mucilaginibacter galii]|uniref:Uncharacterized protein n=1 Tax=Mucilaginibacter galii TaxID=2005073 RepID=A0A917JA20_9SPHI|nr:hypothetical protein [Mucilaginibacter galii]GGI51835.1 hypothetical protein GCM10011425_30470 [Mucilaginibacter galii]
MHSFNTQTYHVKLKDNSTYKPWSTDNAEQYDTVYFFDTEYRPTSMIAIEVYEYDTLLKKVLVGATGGGTRVSETSFVYDEDRLVMCCCDTLFCLSIPELTLHWNTQADMATCFQIFKYKSDYIIHGEMEVSRVSPNGQIVWSQGGADIFLTLDSKQDFRITDEGIFVTDFEYRKYHWDFDGNYLSN